MNNIEKTIEDAIEYWKNDEFLGDKAKYITMQILKNDTEFESALYQIVTEKLEGRS
jgi:hypothetical protein